MVAFGATIIFFIIFFDVQCLGKRNAAEVEKSTDYLDLNGKSKIEFHWDCSLIFKKEYVLSFFFLDKENEELLDKYEHFCGKLKCPILYTEDFLEPSICTDPNVILYSGFMDVISRLPPPGGTTALDIFRTVLITSYHLSSRFMKELHNFPSPSLRVDIVFDADYEAVIGESAWEFRNFLLWHLKRIFRRSRSDIHTLTIKKGSIGITFFINLVNCVRSKKTDNHCEYTKGNSLQEQRKNLYDKIIPVVFHETEFVNFLRYLNYHLNWKHHNLLRKVPYSITTSYPEKAGSFSERLNSLDTEINKMDGIRNKDTLVFEAISDFQYGKGKHQHTSEEPKLPLNREKAPANYFEHRNLHLNRIRRYVAREDEFIMKVEFKLEKPVKNGNNDEFQRHLVSQLAKAMRVPIPSIKDIKIASETDVSFTLSAFNDDNNVMDDINVIEAADSLKMKIRAQKLTLRDLNGQLLMTAGSVYASVDDSSDYSLVILVMLSITLVLLAILIITVVYIARRTSRIPRNSSKRRKEAYRDVPFGRDSSQSIGKYSYDSGLWLGPGPEPNFTVPEAPFYRPPTVEQIASTPRPVTAVRTRLKKNWNVDERALSTIPDGFGRNYLPNESPPPR